MTRQDGTQAIRRAGEILQRIARITEGSEPTLGNISASVGLPRSTTHRILKCLTEMGLAAYDQKSRCYQIGPLTYELGLAVSDGALDLIPWQSAVDRIARRTQVTTYLMRRSGIEAVCLYKADGTSLIRVMPVEVGQRRYLGVGAGATALLAALDDRTIDRVVSAIEPELVRFANTTPESIRETVEATRQTGFTISRGRVYSSIFGLGVAIPAPSGPPELAVSIAVHETDVTDERIRLWKDALTEELGLPARSAELV